MTEERDLWSRNTDPPKRLKFPARRLEGVHSQKSE
jgi:hypothetical protein